MVSGKSITNVCLSIPSLSLSQRLNRRCGTPAFAKSVSVAAVDVVALEILLREGNKGRGASLLCFPILFRAGTIQERKLAWR